MSQPYVLGSHIGDWYWMVESPRGIFKAPGSPTDAEWIAKMATCSFIERHAKQPIAVGNLLSPYASLEVGKDYMLSLAFNPVVTDSMPFLAYGLDESPGEGSVLSSLSLACKVTVAGSDTYIKMKNCQIVSAALGFGRSGALSAQVQISGLLHARDANAPTNWTLIDDPENSPLTSLDGGTTPLAIKDLTTGTTETPDLLQLAFSQVNTPSYVPSALSKTWKDNPIAACTRTVAFTTPYIDDGLRTLLVADHYLRATWTVKTATHSIEFNKGKMDTESLTQTPGVIMKPYRIIHFQSSAVS